tara:strand:+ start:61008 stop:62465 length:1458 start_codon:yes stop_codon:yes gene_type:complete
MAQVARISGPLLAANLKRTLSNLAFETDLLYIGALNGRVGIRTSSPNAELNVNGQIETPNFYATRLTGGNVRFSTTGAEAVVGDINLNAVEKIKIDNLKTDNLQVNGRLISSLGGFDIVFDPNQTGTTQFKKNTTVTGNVSATGNVTVPGNVLVGGNFDIGDQATDTIDFDFVNFSQDLLPRRTEDLLNLGSATKTWKDINTGKGQIGDIEIDTNFISTSTFNNNLFIRASGTGAIVMDDIRISGSTLSTTGSNDLELVPGGGSVNIASTKVLKVPVGTEAQRPSAYRDVRYNSTTNFFELFSTAYTPLRGIWSEDRKTYVLANADNSFSFVTNDATNTTLTAAGLETVKLVSQDNITIDNANISSASTNADIVLTATGNVVIGSYAISGNTITNTGSGNMTFSTIGAGNLGVVKFGGTGGFVIPSGGVADRPANVPIGATRYNTTLKYLETWEGTQWANVSGAGDSVTTEYMEELTNIYTLALG